MFSLRKPSGKKKIEKNYGKAVFRAVRPNERISLAALRELATARPGRPGFNQQTRAPRLFKVNFMANDKQYINSRDFRNFIKMRILMLASARGVGIRSNNINWVDIGQYAANKTHTPRYLKISRNGNGQLTLTAQSNNVRRREQEFDENMGYNGNRSIPRVLRGIRRDRIYTWKQLPQSFYDRHKLERTQAILNIAQAAAGRRAITT